MVDLLDGLDASLLIEAKAGFGRGEFQGSGFQAASPELPGKLVGVLDHVLKPASGLAGDNGHGLLVGVAMLGTDNCRREAGP